MFIEKPMIEAVAACFDNVAVYVLTKGDDVLFPIEIFKIEELKAGNRSGYRYVVDMPDLPEEIERRIAEGKLKRAQEGADKEEAGEEKGGASLKDEKGRKKPLGEEIFELKEQGLSHAEIAALLGKSKSTIAPALSEWKKKQRQAAKPVKRTSTVTGKPVEVDIEKARALEKAGWSIEKIADEFNVSEEDMEELLTLK